jgi:hypothetical protein
MTFIFVERMRMMCACIGQRSNEVCDGFFCGASVFTDETNYIIVHVNIHVKKMVVPSSRISYKEWLLKDLKEELKRRSCKVSGKKKDLVER